MKSFGTMVLLVVTLGLFAGCAARSDVAIIEIENDQAGLGKQAEPIYVDPGVQVLANEYRRSSSNDGSNILQKIKVKGPIMIVPAPVAATRPIGH